MIIGVDIGGTKIAAAGFAEIDESLTRVTETRTAPTPSRAGADEVVRVVCELVSGLCPDADLEAVGVGTAGVVNADGMITSATDAISRWAGFALRDTLSATLGVRVQVVNDVHAAAVAEAAIGAGAGIDSMLMVAVGTGIGGAVVFSDGLRRGVTGTAGSLGHIDVASDGALATRPCPCGGRGHVEAMASGPAMEQTYFERTGHRVSLREIDERARGGDPIACGVIEEGAQLLGRALGSANALLDVDAIVVGGGVAEIGDRYLGEVDASYRATAMPGPRRARMVPAGLRVDAAVTGAAMIAWRVSSD